MKDHHGGAENTGIKSVRDALASDEVAPVASLGPLIGPGEKPPAVFRVENDIELTLAGEVGMVGGLAGWSWQRAREHKALCRKDLIKHGA